MSDERSPLLALWAEWGRLLLKIVRERSLWILLGVGLVLLLGAWQSPRALFVDIGGPYDTPHTPGFHQPEQSGQATFRWAGANSSLYFPGLGRPSKPFEVRVQTASGRAPNLAPLQVSVAANGHPLPPVNVRVQGDLQSIRIDPAWIDPASGDLRIDFASPSFQSGADKRDLGFIVDFVRVDLPGGLTLPPLAHLLLLLVSGFLLYWLARGSWLRPHAAWALVLLFFLVCTAVVGLQRLLLTVFTGRLALTLLLALGLIMLAEPLTRALAHAAGWRGERALPEWSWTGLRALVLISAALKVGGLLYPHTNIVDAYFHLKEITYMAEGRPWEQFFGKNLALSVMPKEEWGEARAFIPYSPFFYVIAAPLAQLPWPKELSVPVVMALLDSLRVAFVFLLGLALGAWKGAGRRALAAAAMCCFFPANFLLQQWGNWPTQFSLWLATLWAAIMCLFWTRINWAAWLAGTAVLALTLVSYTVTAVYMGIFIGVLVVLGWLFAPGERRKWLGLALSLVAASIISLVMLYGQYIPTIINETLPTFGSAVNDQGKLTTLRPTLGAFVSGTLAPAMQSYNLAIPYALALAGAFWVLFAFSRTAEHKARSTASLGLVAGRARTTRSMQGSNWWRVWLGAWLLCFPVITAADFYVDQALKEFWFAIPAICVVAGVWLLAIQKKGAFARPYAVLCGLLWTVLVWQSLTLWIFRLLFHNR